MQKQRNIDVTPAGQLDEAALHDLIGYQLAQATIVTNGVFACRVGKPSELRPVEFTILSLLVRNPGVPARQLAQALGFTAANATMWLDRLEARGLIERQRSTTDRRAQALVATPAGALLAQESLRSLLAMEGQILGSLSAAERAMLVELLHKVACCRGRLPDQRPPGGAKAKAPANLPRSLQSL